MYAQITCCICFLAMWFRFWCLVVVDSCRTDCTIWRINYYAETVYPCNLSCRWVIKATSNVMCNINALMYFLNNFMNIILDDCTCYIMCSYNVLLTRMPWLLPLGDYFTRFIVIQCLFDYNRCRPAPGSRTTLPSSSMAHLHQTSRYRCAQTQFTLFYDVGMYWTRLDLVFVNGQLALCLIAIQVSSNHYFVKSNNFIQSFFNILQLSAFRLYCILDTNDRTSTLHVYVVLTA